MTVVEDIWLGESRSEPLPPPMKDKLEKATRHHASGDYNAALDMYQEILLHHPRSGRANYNLAVLARHLNQAEMCERYLKLSIECAETVEEAVRRLLELASLLMLNNRFIDADALIDMAEPYAEGIAEFYEWRGKLKHALERYDDAIASFEKACELKPTVGSYWVQLADSLTKSDTQQDRADHAIRQAAKTNIDDPDTLINISAYYINQSRYADAEPYLKTAFKVAEKQGKPIDAFYRFCLGNVLRHLDDEASALREYEAGLAICEQAIKSAPKRDEVAQSFKGRILYAMGRKNDAREAAEMLRAVTPASDHKYRTDQYLPDTPERIARLKEIVGGRDIALLAHGPSIVKLEERIGELADRDICYVSVNRFSVLESGILEKIDRRVEIVCPTNPTEFQVQGDQIIDFLERDDDNMVITSCYGIAGLPRVLPSGMSFTEQYDRKLLFFFSAHHFPAIPSHPLHFIPANTPSVLIPLLQLAEPKRIYFFGGDGGADLDKGGPSHYRMDTEEFRQQRNETTYARFREKLLVDAEMFNEICEFSSIWTAAFHGVEHAPVYTVSPNSNFRVFPRIGYEQALSEIGIG